MWVTALMAATALVEFPLLVPRRPPAPVSGVETRYLSDLWSRVRVGAAADVPPEQAKELARCGAQFRLGEPTCVLAARQVLLAPVVSLEQGDSHLYDPSAAAAAQRFSQIEMCLVLVAVNPERSQSPKRWQRVIPAMRAMRSSSLGHT